jgi:predicted TIM-barrel fold metal-dependent hydrolase
MGTPGRRVIDAHTHAFPDELADRAVPRLAREGGLEAALDGTIADPARIARVLELVPGLKLIAPHLGAWDDWEEVERLLVGRPVVFDVAFVLGFMDPTRLRRILLRHPADCLVFGSDSPWADQPEALRGVLALDLPEERLQALLWGNAARLLKLDAPDPGAR